MRLPLVVVVALGCTDVAEQVPTHLATSPVCWHSHNDYLQKRPLFDALELGFASVEADVHLVDGVLLVAHDRADCRPERTLEALYLRPLARLARSNGGKVMTSLERPFVLLVDIKSNGEGVYGILQLELEPLRDVLTSWDGTRVTERAVTIVISGATPRSTIAAQRERLVFVDGRLADLKGPAAGAAPTNLVPMVSISWLETVGWLGIGEFPATARAKLADLVALTRARGYRLRFWGTPNLVPVWRALHEAGVAVIGVDLLGEAARWSAGFDERHREPAVHGGQAESHSR